MTQVVMTILIYVESWLLENYNLHLFTLPKNPSVCCSMRSGGLEL